MPGNRIELLYMDFQSIALPLSYPIFFNNLNDNNIAEVGFEPTLSDHESNDLTISLLLNVYYYFLRELNPCFRLEKALSSPLDEGIFYIK